MNNGNDLKFANSMTKLSGWLRNCFQASSNYNNLCVYKLKQTHIYI
jgi:hypothetical protein